jgi:hypothetical protein
VNNSDTETSTGITDPILIEHGEFRTRFANLWVMRGEGDAAERTDAWRGLGDLLEVHATAEEEILYPVPLKRGGDQAPAETADAIGDHNQIRDAIKPAARGASGTDFWWAALHACRKANDEHLAEEERDVIPDFRLHTDATLRWELDIRWQSFHSSHKAAHGISGDDVDPAAFVTANS